MISSAPSILPASLPSRRRLGLCLLCQETQQQNLKPPQLLPPLSPLSSYDLRLWQRGRPGLSVPCQVRSLLTLDLSGFLRWLVFCSPPFSLPLPFSLLLCVCVHSEGLAGISLPAPGGLCRPEWSRFLPAITMWEIRGAAADKGISRPSGAVRAGRVTSGAGPAARCP